MIAGALLPRLFLYGKALLMIVNVRIPILLAVLSLLHPLSGPVPDASAEEGMWSKSAFAIPRQRVFKVPSPDRKKTILVSDLSLVVIDGGSPLPGIEGYTLLLPAEVAWAPDSKAFSITSNEGGSGEEAWFVTVYVLEFDRVNYYDITAEAAIRFKEMIKCPDAGEPHFGAIKWVKESKNLLVVAEASERASCPDKGAFRGYTIEVPSGKVLNELEPKALLDRWGEYLGPRITKKTLR
jgi:hypothetical protein